MTTTRAALPADVLRSRVATVPTPGPGAGAASRVAVRLLLEELGAGAVPHSHGSLLDHLLGTAGILERWGVNEDVIRGGLLHSVYGTESFPHATLPLHERARVRVVAGKRAERLAFLFGTLRRSSVVRAARAGAAPLAFDRQGREVRLSPFEIGALINLILANELEQRDRLPTRAGARRTRLRFHDLRRWLSPRAIADLQGDTPTSPAGRERHPSTLPQPAHPFPPRTASTAPVSPDRADKPFLRRLLHIEQARRFLREGWTDRVFVGRGPVARWAGLAERTFEDLCRMKSEFTRAFFRNARGEVRHATLRPGEELAAYEAGATIYFHGLQGSGVEAWVEGLDAELGLVRGLTRVSAFASIEGPGLTPHYDLNDNFVCQVHGRKRWRVAPNTHVRYPLYGYTMGRPLMPPHRVEAPSGLPAEMPKAHRTVEMTAGMVMFVPRGCWHDTVTTGESSLHFNIQLGLPTWRDLLDFAIARTGLPCAAALRAPVLDAFDDAGALRPAVHRQLADKVEALLEALRAGESSVQRGEFDKYAALRRTRLFEYPY